MVSNLSNRSSFEIELLEYRPKDDAERDRVRSFMDLLDKEEDPFGRPSAIGHLTASAWVVDVARTNVLLVLHKKLGIWVQPGGHADGIKNLHQVAIKETEEECGIAALREVSKGIFDLDIHHIPANEKTPAHLHFDVRYAFQATVQSGEIRTSSENLDVRWVPIDKVQELTRDTSVLRMRQKWLALDLI